MVAGRRVWTRVALTVRLLPAGTLPAWPARRHPLDTSGIVGTIVTTVAATCGRATVIAVLATVLALDAAVTAGAAVVSVLVVGAAVGIGVVVHELGHALALAGVPSALVTAGPRTYVLHATLRPARS